MDNSKYIKAKLQVEKYNQKQLINFMDELSDEASEKLLNQILSIDFDLMGNLIESNKNISSISLHTPPLQNYISPINSESIDNFDNVVIQKYYDSGMNALSNGHIAVVTMAGGQGTRLGHDGPKGTFDIGLPSAKTLFQLQTERLKALSEKCGRWISWYIMTSEDNHSATVKHFVDMNYFGYPADAIFFFKQGMLPLVSPEGKILLKEKDEILFGSDGNGGVFRSLKQSKALDDMRRKGIEWVLFCGIDNALTRMADPVFIGYTLLSGKNAASKSVLKKHPAESVGVFCRQNGKPAIIEYSELPEEYKIMKNCDDELLFGEANILTHLLKFDVLCEISDIGLPYHAAFKKVSCLDYSGRKVAPEKPDAFKFETFIFDAFKHLDDMAILRVVREKEFAPVKNRKGEDSPETARKLVMEAEGMLCFLNDRNIYNRSFH